MRALGRTIISQELSVGELKAADLALPQDLVAWEWLAVVVDGVMEQLGVLQLVHHKLFRAEASSLMKTLTQLQVLALGN
jgi:hypothetical protein